jgi:hypothetical protein
MVVVFAYVTYVDLGQESSSAGKYCAMRMLFEQHSLGAVEE